MIAFNYYIINFTKQIISCTNLLFDYMQTTSNYYVRSKHSSVAMMFIRNTEHAQAFQVFCHMILCSRFSQHFRACNCMVCNNSSTNVRVFMSGIYSFYSGTFESVDQHRYSCVITIFLLDILPSYRSSFCPISCVVSLLLSRPNCPASRKIQFYSIRVSMLKLFSEGKGSYLNSQKKIDRTKWIV